MEFDNFVASYEAVEEAQDEMDRVKHNLCQEVMDCLPDNFDKERGMVTIMPHKSHPDVYTGENVSGYTISLNLQANTDYESIDYVVENAPQYKQLLNYLSRGNLKNSLIEDKIGY